MVEMFSALSQVPGFLPQFETKRALIIINMQNDSLYCDDDVYITKNKEFVDRIKALVPHFRKMGEVVWIRTEMGTKSFPTSPGSAYIEEEVAKIDEKNREERKLEEELLEDDTVSKEETVSNGVEEAQPERQNLESCSPTPVQTYHPTSRTQAMMKRASAKSRAEQRSANMDVFNDGGDVFDEQVSKPRKGQQPKFYIGGTLGAEIADQLLSVVDESRDLIVTKHHYSSFDQTSLLMSLRMKLVTDVYLCGCLTNVGVYATAADAVQHGLGVTVVEDCLGYRSEAKHEDAMRQMADIMGVNGVDSEEIIEESGGRAPPDSEEPIFTGPGPEGITLHTLSIDGKSPKLDAADAFQRTVDLDRPEIEAPVSPTNMSKDATSADLDHETRSSVSVDPTHAVEVATATDPVTDKQAAQRSISLSDGLTPLPSPDVSSGKKRDSWISVGTHTMGPNDSIGSGDSRIIHDVLSSAVMDDAFQLLKEEINWQTMHHRSGKVPRLVAVQGEIDRDGSVPLYRHPADESPRLLSYSPTIQKIRKEIEESLKQPFNHALIQLYRDGNDNISEHSDKTLDITRGSSVVNVSLGAQRVMTLRSKKTRRGHGTESPGAPRQVQRIPMPHNSVFVLGPKTNLHWLHGVRADKRPQQQRSTEEKSFGGERISITFRQIGTFMNPETKKIWGSGAKQKSKATAGTISTANDAEMEAMIVGFGKENHQSDFDWDQEYGIGFDVINLVSEKTKLTLCDDKVANLRVRLSLAEKSIAYLLGDRLVPAPEDNRAKRYKFHPWTHGLSNTQKPIFEDVDEDASKTEGDLAILFYLEKFYPFTAPEGASARELHRATALVFTRASKSNELLFWWRELQSTLSMEEPISSSEPSTAQRPLTPNLSLLEEFHGDLDTWEGYAAEAEYIAGDFWTIIDCAFWPVLDEIISGWDKLDEQRYPKLLAYHQRVFNRECVRKTLDGLA